MKRIRNLCASVQIFCEHNPECTNFFVKKPQLCALSYMCLYYWYGSRIELIGEILLYSFLASKCEKEQRNQNTRALYQNTSHDDICIPHVLPSGNSELMCFQTRGGNCIPNGMFKLFGDYSGCDAQTVRDELDDWLQDNTNEVRSVVTRAMLPAPHQNLTGWLMTM